MQSDESADKVNDIVTEAVGAVKASAEKAKEMAEATFTKENAEALKSKMTAAAGQAADAAREMLTKENMERAKETAIDAAHKASEFARQKLTKENFSSAKAAVTEELGNLKTAEGRAEARLRIVCAAKALKHRLLTFWASGKKGKIVISAACLLIILCVKSCFWGGGDDAAVASGETSGGTVPVYVYQCKYCFKVICGYSASEGTKYQCRKGHGHSWNIIGERGPCVYGCTKCGQEFPVTMQPCGYKDCPRGNAHQWRQLR